MKKHVTVLAMTPEQVAALKREAEDPTTDVVFALMKPHFEAALAAAVEAGWLVKLADKDNP